MNITQVVIRKYFSVGKLRAIVSVTFDEQLVVHDIKVIDGPQGMFVSMPSRRRTDNRFLDIVHPINSEFRNVLSEAILDAFDRHVEESETEVEQA